MSSISFDRAAEYYDETRGYEPGVDSDVADLLVQVGGLNSNSRVLEVGIGTGRLALPLADRVGCVVGVDLSAPMLTRLVEKRGTRAVFPICADATALPFRDGQFDVVLCFHVLHLIPPWAQVLAEIRRVLAPGGRLLFGRDHWGTAMAPIWRRGKSSGSRIVGLQPGPERVGVLADHGWLPIAEPVQIERIKPLDLGLALRNLERRVWSSTWRMSDEKHAALVAFVHDGMMREFGRVIGTVPSTAAVEAQAFLHRD